MTKKVCTTFPLLKIRNSSSKKIVVIPKFDHEKLEVLEDKAIDGLPFSMLHPHGHYNGPSFSNGINCSLPCSEGPWEIHCSKLQHPILV